LSSKISGRLISEGSQAGKQILHFKPALKRPEDYVKLVATMKAAFVRQGKEGIVKARAVEDRLMRDTWEVDSYDLLPKLQTLSLRRNLSPRRVCPRCRS